MTPRRCQLEALQAALTSIHAGSPDVIEMITGAGKSIALALVMRELPASDLVDLVVTSRTELVESLAYTFWRMLDPEAQQVPLEDRERRSAVALKACRDSARIGRYDGHVKQIRPLTVTTYPSLGACIEAAGGVGRVRLLMCDEAHRTRGPQIRRVVQSVPCRLGWTATPYPGDPKGRLPGWANVVYQYGAEDAVADGVIVPFEVREATEDHVGIRDNERAIDTAIRMILAAGDIGPGLVTAPNLATAQNWARKMTDAGIPALAAVRRCKAYPEGLTPKELRKAYAASRRGEIRALITVDLLAEGVDLPWLRWLALCAKPGDRIHLVQVVGRVLRTCKADQWGEKKQAIVFDPCRILKKYKLYHVAALGEDGRQQKPISAKKAAELARARVVAGALTEFVTALETWSSGLLDQVRAWSISGRSRMTPAQFADEVARMRVSEARTGPRVRTMSASEYDVSALRRMDALVSYIGGEQGEEHRRQIRELAEGGRMPAGVCHDLRTALGYIAYRRRMLRGGGNPPAALYRHGFCRIERLGLPASVEVR